MPRGAHIGYALTVNDKCGDVPHHNEYTGGATKQQHTHKAHLAQVLGRKKK